MFYYFKNIFIGLTCYILGPGADPLGGDEGDRHPHKFLLQLFCGTKKKIVKLSSTFF